MFLLTPFEAYLFWAVPSLMGFFLNVLVIANIVYSPPLRKKYYQQWSALLAACNVLSATAWLLGPKYSSHITPRILCVLQEYIFLLASMCLAMVSLFICFVAMSSVVWRSLPTSRRMLAMLGSMLLLAVLLVLGCVVNRTASLFCNGGIDDFYSNGEWSRSFVAYMLLFITPLVVIISLEFVVCVVTLRRLSLGLVPSLGSQRSENTYNQQMGVFSTRLLAYPMIFIFCWSLNIASLVHSVATRSFDVIMGFMSGMLMSSCTVLMGLNYFYFQHTYARFLVPLLRRLKRGVVVTAEDCREKSSMAEMVSSSFAGSQGASVSRHNSEALGRQSDFSCTTMNALRQGSTASDFRPDDFYLTFTGAESFDSFSVE